MKNPIDPRFPRIRRFRPAAVLLLGAAIMISGIVFLKPELESREITAGPILVGGLVVTLILIIVAQIGARDEGDHLNETHPYQASGERPQMSKTVRIMMCLMAFAGLIIAVNGDHISSVRSHGVSFGPGPSENEVLGLLSMLMLGAVFLVGVKVFLNPPD